MASKRETATCPRECVRQETKHRGKSRAYRGLQTLPGLLCRRKLERVIANDCTASLASLRTPQSHPGYGISSQTLAVAWLTSMTDGDANSCAAEHLGLFGKKSALLKLDHLWWVPKSPLCSALDVDPTSLASSAARCVLSKDAVNQHRLMKPQIR